MQSRHSFRSEIVFGPRFSWMNEARVNSPIQPDMDTMLNRCAKMYCSFSFSLSLCRDVNCYLGAHLHTYIHTIHSIKCIYIQSSCCATTTCPNFISSATYCVIRRLHPSLWWVFICAGIVNRLFLSSVRANVRGPPAGTVIRRRVLMVLQLPWVRCLRAEVTGMVACFCELPGRQWPRDHRRGQHLVYRCCTCRGTAPRSNRIGCFFCRFVRIRSSFGWLKRLHGLVIISGFWGTVPH